MSFRKSKYSAFIVLAAVLLVWGALMLAVDESGKPDNSTH